MWLTKWMGDYNKCYFSWKTELTLICSSMLVQVRFAALKVIEEMSRKLGDSYKVVLPETIVTLTELNEGKEGDLVSSLLTLIQLKCFVSSSGT